MDKDIRRISAWNPSRTVKRRARIRFDLRKWIGRRGRSVQDHVLHGAAYGLGSGAVSLVVVWVQSRF
ncbi:hypothetical protein [Streptomyces sp. NBC_01176]|uniref:hypothetical protein n=1 Tax=Streptomyces sp. NBC_01176 TaxID=2903760 RepID=UPI002F915B4D|nr:hypothetical protein OG199_44210 [Streptomyces sp. NBC_01176]